MFSGFLSVLSRGYFMSRFAVFTKHAFSSERDLLIKLSGQGRCESCASTQAEKLASWAQKETMAWAAQHWFVKYCIRKQATQLTIQEESAESMFQQAWFYRLTSQVHYIGLPCVGSFYGKPKPFLLFAPGILLLFWSFFIVVVFHF